MGPTPSERTIESLSNHGFLDVLNHGKNAPPFAWFFLPTQVEEYFLGYDADLAAHKRLYIQYKRMSGINRFKFDFRQIWVMAAHLDRYTRPYVLLSGNVAKSNLDVGNLHTDQGVSRYAAFNETFFLDAWDVLQKVCEAVYGGPISSFPSSLPTPPARADLGFVALKQSGGVFNIDILSSGRLVPEVSALLQAIGLPPVALISASPSKILGWGEGFAEATNACNFGKPMKEIAPLSVKVQWREMFDREDENERRQFRRMSVLTLPMPL